VTAGDQQATENKKLVFRFWQQPWVRFFRNGTLVRCVAVATTYNKETAMATTARTEREQDKALEDSFPASDPPANSGVTGPEAADRSGDQRPAEEIPTGTPTSDRHATETAHHQETDVPTPKK
jgi:hypothetical protein